GALSAGAAAVAAPLWGATADRLRSSRVVMPAAAIGAAVSATVVSLVQPVLPLIIAVAALAAFMAGVAPILDARALEVAGGDRNRYSLLRVWGSASFIGSVLLVGWLIDQTRITAMFAVLAAALLATGVIGLAFRGRAATVAALPHLAGIGAVIRSPLLGPFLLAILLVWSSNMAINAFFSIHLVEIGADGALVGAAWAIGAVVEVPVMLGYPWLGGRLGVERLLLVGAAIFLVRALAVLLLQDPLLATATMGLHGIGFALALVGGVVYVSRHAPPGAEATAQGVLGATVFGVAAIVGPGVGGLLAGWLGLEGMFLVATTGCGLAVLALAWALRPVLRGSTVAGAVVAPIPEDPGAGSR
ncbi:MAG TPA: MFS transporter, partial [Candidatus Limnocylindria bacterium]|nr:MFS transporter [Candidatus Limnocylindria bacterium]